MSLHLPFGVALALGIVGVAVANVADTVQTLAVTRDKAQLAGAMSALGVLAGLLVQVSAVGSVLLYGIGWRAGVVLAVVVVASYFSATFSTVWAGSKVVQVARSALRL